MIWTLSSPGLRERAVQQCAPYLKLVIWRERIADGSVQPAATASNQWIRGRRTVKTDE